ncbi:hypothetical protein AAC387_Pa01g1608 [Persea americana]
MERGLELGTYICFPTNLDYGKWDLNERQMQWPMTVREVRKQLNNLTSKELEWRPYRNTSALEDDNLLDIRMPKRARIKELLMDFYKYYTYRKEELDMIIPVLILRPLEIYWTRALGWIRQSYITGSKCYGKGVRMHTWLTLVYVVSGKRS